MPLDPNRHRMLPLKADFSDMEREIIEAGIADYKRPSVGKSPFEIALANPLYGTAVYLPLPTSDKQIQAAIDAVSGNGQWDWEIVDYEIHADDIDLSTLRQIDSLRNLNHFAETYLALSPIQLEWAIELANYSGDSIRETSTLVLYARKDLYSLYASEVDSRAFNDKTDALYWYADRLPMSRYLGHLDYEQVDAELVSGGFVTSLDDLEDPDTAVAATERWMKKVGKQIVYGHILWESIEDDFDTGDWLTAVEGKQGVYIFGAENNRPSS